MNANSNPTEIVIEVTQEEYENELAAGLRDDEVLLPGQHSFRRGGFLERHGIDSQEGPGPVKVRVTIDLDVDLMTYFNERASDPGEPPYQVQINKALRKIMEQEERGDWT